MEDRKPAPVKHASDSETLSGSSILGSEGPTAAVAPALEPGKVLGGRYEILQLLGQGGMGAVFKARDRELDRCVALKIVHPELARHSTALQRFKQELILASQVTHKNVIRIHDVGEAQGIKFITMDYIEGEDLSSTLKSRGKLPIAEAVEVIEQVARALEAAHAEGVIHRDLKPQNVMRDQHGRVVVTDFGLARSSDATRMTQTGALVGTMEYMSPEQALGKSVDTRSDLFALGLIFYQLLTGELPFHAETPFASLVKRTQEAARPPSGVNPAIPHPLNNIVLKCLETDPERRYQSASEVLADIAAWKAGQALSVITRPGGRFPLRLRPWHATAAALVLFVAAATMVVRYRIPKSPPPHALVTVLLADFQNATSDPVFDGTLEPAFTVAMEGAPFITSYSRGQAHKLAAQLQPGTNKLDEHVARLVATREGVNVVIGGTIARDGESYRVTVRALDGLTGKLMATDSEQVQKQDVLAALARLSAGIRKALGDTTAQSVQLAAAETYTTASLEAAHEYGIGQEALWAGNYEEAIGHYRKSVALDPDMGRAYSGLAVASIILGRNQDGMNYYKLALSKIDRMSEREKYRTRGTYYVVTRNTDKAIEELSELVRRYPSDSSGFANLALAYFYRRDMARALQEGRHAVEISPKNVLQRNNVGLYAMYAGDFDTAIREQQAVLELNPSLAKGFLGIALSQAGKGDIAAALDTYHHLEKQGRTGASTASAGLADLALYQSRASDAIKILETAISSDLGNREVDAAAIKYTLLADANLLLGRTGEALAAADQAVANSKEAGVLVFAARIYLQARQEAKALGLARQLLTRTERDSQAYGKLIEGEIQLQHGKTMDAIKTFKEAKSIADAWLVRFDSGRAYIAAGQFPEADSELELCLNRRGEATAAFLDDVPTIRLLPPVYYYLGRAQEGLKSPAAAASFQTFISMKSGGADPLLADARRRVSRP